MFIYFVYYLSLQCYLKLIAFCSFSVHLLWAKKCMVRVKVDSSRRIRGLRQQVFNCPLRLLCPALQTTLTLLHTSADQVTGDNVDRLVCVAASTPKKPYT